MCKRIICQQCGALNVLSEKSNNCEIIPCEIPKDLDWVLPMKKTITAEGEEIFIDQQGKPMSREQYIQTHNLDPAIAQEMMKYHVGVYVGDR
jgi:hypothetical protein